MNRRWAWMILTGLLLVVAPLFLLASSRSSGGNAAALPRANLSISHDGRVVARVRAEVAATAEARARGLMFRKTLGRDEGMLLLWPTSRRVAIWMKNTYLPLDIVFIDVNGRVVRVHERARPLATRIIPSGTPVIAVLEVPAGMAKRLGLRRGAVVSLPRHTVE